MPETLPIGTTGPPATVLRRFAGAFAGALVLMVLAAIPASAHAVLVASDPPSGAGLARSPHTVTLWFDERIDGPDSAGRLVDENGRDVPGVRSTVGADPTVLELALPEVAAGRYSVLWQVRSADDGHRGDGAIVFTAGLVGADGPRATPGGGSPSAWEAVLGWLGLIALAGVVGGLAVSRVVLPRPARRHLPSAREPLGDTARDRLGRMIGVCAVAGLLVAAADLITRAATTPPPAAGWVGRVAAMVTSTEWGLLWAARFAALAAIVGVLVRARRHREDLGRTADRRLDVFLGICLVALAVAGAVDGHPSSVASATAWAIAADAVHLLSAALWIGALAALVVVIASPGRRALLRVCRFRFSMLMAATVVALVISGLLEVGRQIDRVPDVLETGYGLLVTAKAVLLLVMLGLALANALALHELGSRRRAGGGIRRGGVFAEATLGVLVLALAAVLVQTAPPRGPRTESAAAERSGATRTATSADLLVALTVTPNWPGYNGFLVSLASTRRPDPVPVGSAVLDVGGGTLPLADLGEGQYYATGQLPAAGPVTVRVIAHRTATDAVVDIPWTVRSASTGAAVDRPLVPWTDALALAGLLIVDVAALTTLWLMAHRRRRRAVNVAGLIEPPSARGSR